jgi:hypothetical protein
MLTSLNSEAGRAGLKRKSDQPTIDREILLMEDAAYLLKKWEALRSQAQKLQPERVYKIRGCIDTRFEYSVNALRLTLGLTIVCERLVALWDKALKEPDRPPAGGLKGRVMLVAVERVVAADPWHKEGKFDLTSAPPMLLFADFLDAYSGPFILPQLDLIGSWLNPDKVSFEELQEEDATLQLPDGYCCPLPSEGKLAEKLPSFLLDVGDIKLRIDCAISEVIGQEHFMPHVHFVELRRFGIFFEAHDEIEKHRALLKKFEADDWLIDAVHPFRSSFARALDFLLRYARRHDHEDWARERVGQKMGEYSTYYHDQTEEWFTNPASMIGRLGSVKSGVKAAREMVTEGKAELIAAVAAVLHVDSPKVRSALQREEYHGPLLLLVSDEL